MLACAAAASPAAQAQATIFTDLEIQAVVTPTGILMSGTTAKLELIFINHGPADAPRVVTTSSAFTFLDHALFDFQPALPHPCATSFDDIQAPPGSGEPSYLIAHITAGPMASRSTTRCTFDLLITPNAIGKTEISFAVGDALVFVQDPRGENDVASASMEFRAPPARVPALTLAGVATAVLTLLLGATKRSYRQ